jgi:hypothetical protein
MSDFIHFHVVKQPGAAAQVTYPGKVSTPTKAMTLGDFPDFVDTGWLHAPWGVDDMMPTQMRRKLRSVPMAGAAVDKLVKMMYGNGLVYVKNSDIEEGETDLHRAYDPRVEAFLKKNRTALAWYVAQCFDYRLYAMTFTEMVLSADGKEIVEMYHKAAEFCRFSRQDERDNKVKYVGYSPKFAQGYTNPDDITWIPLYRWYERDAFFSGLRGRKFVWASCLPVPGLFYYPEAPWFGLFSEKGWLDVSANVPRIVNAMQSNQISLKYIIQISQQYFRMRHREWDAYTDEQRLDAFRIKAAEIETYLSGADNMFKSLTYMVQEDEITGNKTGLIEIIAVDDKTKTGTWVPDSATADAQIVQGLGLHPSQVGLAPQGGKMGAGSGSDQRESFNTAIGLNTLEQDIILEVLQFVSDYNGWGVTFMVDHTMHTTTNNKEDGMVPSSTTVQVS